MTAAPQPSEFDLHCAVADLVRKTIEPGWRWTHIASGEYRPPATAGRLKKMGVAKGWPDFVFVSEYGLLCFLELKRPGGRLSPEQRDIAQHLTRAGFNYLCSDNFDYAVDILRAWGVVRPGVHVQ